VKKEKKKGGQKEFRENERGLSRMSLMKGSFWRMSMGEER